MSLSIKESALSKFGISASNIQFSNIVPSTEGTINSFSNNNVNQVNLIELQNVVIGLVIPQIKKIDSEYKVLEVKYKI